jgi:hypothetical protein
LVINNECNGEDKAEPGGPGESRRIKAFKWFSNYFDFRLEDDRLLTCRNMVKPFDQIAQSVSWQPDWSSTWKPDKPCNCAPAAYGGTIPYFDEKFYPKRFSNTNELNRMACAYALYLNPSLFGLNTNTSACLNVPLPASWIRHDYPYLALRSSDQL